MAAMKNVEVQQISSSQSCLWQVYFYQGYETTAIITCSALRLVESERSRNINTTATENLKCFIKSSQGSEDKRDSAQNFSFQKCNQTTRIKEDISIFSST